MVLIQLVSLASFVRFQPAFFFLVAYILDPCSRILQDSSGFLKVLGGLTVIWPGILWASSGLFKGLIGILGNTLRSLSHSWKLSGIFNHFQGSFGILEGYFVLFLGSFKDSCECFGIFKNSWGPFRIFEGFLMAFRRIPRLLGSLMTFLGCFIPGSVIQKSINVDFSVTTATDWCYLPSNCQIDESTRRCRVTDYLLFHCFIF